MNIKAKNMITFISLIILALSAGLFYSWSFTVVPGLGNIQDQSYLEAFQAMNRAILNPAFFLIFMGPIIILPIVSFLQFKTAVDSSFWMVFSATLLYLVGVIIVTFAGNVPLNNTIEVVDIQSLSNTDMESLRMSFENKWNQFNMIRTVSSVLAFIVLLASVVDIIQK